VGNFSRNCVKPLELAFKLDPRKPTLNRKTYTFSARLPNLTRPTNYTKRKTKENLDAFKPHWKDFLFLFWYGALSKRQSEDSLFAPITHTQCFLRIQTTALQSGVSDCKSAFLRIKITALSCNTWKGTFKTLAFIIVFLAIINFSLFPTQHQQCALNLHGNTQRLIQGLSSIAAPSTAALPHKEPSSTGTSPDSCANQDNDKRNALYIYIPALPVCDKHTFPSEPLCIRKTSCIVIIWPVKQRKYDSATLVILHSPNFLASRPFSGLSGDCRRICVQTLDAPLVHVSTLTACIY
jgi:hypothetical protein